MALFGFLYFNNPTNSQFVNINNQNIKNISPRLSNTYKNILEVKSPELFKPVVKPINIVKKPTTCIRVNSTIIKQEMINQAILLGYDSNQLEKLNFIAGRESGLNNCAQNPRSSAFGIFQFLDATWKGYGCIKTIDYKEQIRCGLKYIQIRYKGIDNAYNFWLKNKWY